VGVSFDDVRVGSRGRAKLKLTRRAHERLDMTRPPPRVGGLGDCEGVFGVSPLALHTL
jgi:hypothetical protein